MYDLIYANDEARKVLEAEYPDAQFEDASDYVHQERFSILMPDDKHDEEAYWRFLLQHDLALLSLNTHLILLTPSAKSHKALMALCRDIREARIREAREER